MVYLTVTRSIYPIFRSQRNLIFFMIEYVNTLLKIVQSGQNRTRFYRLIYVRPPCRRWFTGSVTILTTWGSSWSLPSVTLVYLFSVSTTRLPLPLTLGTCPDDKWFWVRTTGRWGPLPHWTCPFLVGWKWCPETLGPSSSGTLVVPVNATVPLDESIHQPRLDVGRTSGQPNYTLVGITSYRSLRVRGSKLN